MNDPRSCETCRAFQADGAHWGTCSNGPVKTIRTVMGKTVERYPYVMRSDSCREYRRSKNAWPDLEETP